MAEDDETFVEAATAALLRRRSDPLRSVSAQYSVAFFVYLRFSFLATPPPQLDETEGAGEFDAR